MSRCLSTGRCDQDSADGFLGEQAALVEDVEQAERREDEHAPRAPNTTSTAVSVPTAPRPAATFSDSGSM